MRLFCLELFFWGFCETEGDFGLLQGWLPQFVDVALVEDLKHILRVYFDKWKVAVVIRGDLADCCLVFDLEKHFLRLIK